MSLLCGQKLIKNYYVSKGWWQKEEVQAVRGVDLDLGLELNHLSCNDRNNNIGLVGESGSGKSTLARLISRLEKPSRGSLYFRGKEISNLPEKELLFFRKQVQIIFQDAAASLNHRHSVEKILSEPVRNFYPEFSRSERREKIIEIMEQVGLSGKDYRCFPHEFSGGQKRRLAIARAVIVYPSLLICDEATSGLDVSLQGQLLNLFLELGEKFAMNYLLVSHDLPAVRYLCSRILVMYAGMIVEDFSAKEQHSPVHPYTRALLKSEPSLDSSFSPQFLPGEPPDPSAHPTGCSFHPRCFERRDICMEAIPELKETSERHRVACHLA